MTTFSQQTDACRCEWGICGLDALAPADVTVIVDVLSFSTCVDVATSRGVIVLPCAWQDSSAWMFAQRQQAELAVARGEDGYSLSPASFLSAPSGMRCVLPSPNGATLTLHAARTSTAVLSGCLRNATAVARFARTLGRTFNVCPAGERWPDGSLRLAFEDWLGAGAILRQLPGSRSPEAAAAVALFECFAPTLAAAIEHSGSGRELIERGFQQDVALSSALDVSSCVPRFDGEAFLAAG